MYRYPLYDARRSEVYPRWLDIAGWADRVGFTVHQYPSLPDTMIIGLNPALPRLIINFDPAYPLGGMRSIGVLPSTAPSLIPPSSLRSIRDVLTRDKHFDVQPHSNPMSCIHVFIYLTRIQYRCSLGIEPSDMEIQLAQSMFQIDAPPLASSHIIRHPAPQWRMSILPRYASRRIPRPSASRDKASSSGSAPEVRDADSPASTG